MYIHIHVLIHIDTHIKCIYVYAVKVCAYIKDSRRDVQSKRTYARSSLPNKEPTSPRQNCPIVYSPYI